MGYFKLVIVFGSLFVVWITIIILYYGMLLHFGGTDLHLSAGEIDLTGFDFPEILEEKLCVKTGDLGMFFSRPETWREILPNRLKRFQPTISPIERLMLLFVFDAVVKVCLHYNLMFMLYSGSLLGAYRHHNMIPWDDDIDIMMNISDKAALKKAFDTLLDPTIFKVRVIHHDKDFSLNFNDHWQVCLKNSITNTNWPFIEIFFFSENETHIYDSEKRYSKTFIFRKSDVFPLSSRPFNGMLLPTPCNVEEVLKKTAPNLTECSSLSWDHVHRVLLRPIIKVPCSNLQGFLPFVTNRYHKNGYNWIEEITSADGKKRQITISKQCNGYRP